MTINNQTEMKKTATILLLLLGVTLSFVRCTQSSKENSSKIGLIMDVPEAEAKAVHEFLGNQEALKSTILNKDVDLESLDLTHIWIHQFSKNKQSAMEASIKKFVKNGGNLILSMEAMHLLNTWGIEKNNLESKTDSIVDEGFGRPLGFHGFKDHPIFDGLQGGAYPWKSKEDHKVKKIGFFNEQLPDTTIAKVLGIEWTYITFHENNKLVLEYDYGKGKIIAVGAYSYFSKENYNTHELHRFYTNIIDYMAGDTKNIGLNYWKYAPQKVLPLKQQFSSLAISNATKWQLPKLSLNLKRKEASNNATLMTGRRMMIGGVEKGGIEEIWTNPFMSFRDIETGVLLKNSDSVTWLSDLTPSITSSPELLIREYKIAGTVLKEITTVSMDKPVGVVHYEWEGNDFSKIMIKYTSNLRYMWPYSEKVTASISYKWVPEINAAVNIGQSGELASIIGFSSKPDSFLMGQYDDFKYNKGKFTPSKTDLIQVSGVFSFDTEKANGKLNTYLVADDSGIQNAIDIYSSESKNFNQLYLKTSDYYTKLLNNSLMLTTPDTKFNTGYKWAMVRTDQFFQETPNIGTTIVAGLGTTSRGWDGNQKINGRPGYAWYFGRDAQWCGFAVNAYGGHEMVKKILDVFITYQNLNGKIFHELTTSGAVHFDASDSTPLYIILAAHYLKYSGDLEYINKIWPSLKRAMDFCYSTDTDNDGLIEITNVGHGWVEGGSLFGTHTEIYLAGTWAATLESAAYITNHLDKKGLSESYNKDAQKVKKIIDTDFWNEEGQYFYNGKMTDGSFMDAETVLAGVPVYFNAVTDPKKAFKTAAAYAGNMYTADWGVRIIPESSEKFHPRSYHGGMVWPLFTGWASLAEYKTGNYTSAYSHIMNNALIYQHWNLGGVEETLHGAKFEPAGVCSQQGWSETMVLQPVSEGMLGIVPDALSNSISLSPHFPWHWNEVKVDNILFGNHRIHMSMLKTPTTTTYEFKEVLKEGSKLNFTPSFPLGTIINKVLINGKNTEYKIVENAESIELALGKQLLNSIMTIEVNHKNGIGAIPLINEPQPGDTNKGAKIISQQLKNNQFKVVIEGLPNTAYQFEIMSNLEIKNLTNGTIVNKKENVYTIQTKTKVSGQKYAEQIITLTLID